MGESDGLHEVLQANCENPPDRTGLTNPQGSKRLSLIELANMQRALHKLALKRGQDARTVTTCALAWKQLESQRLDTAGQPRPGQYRPELKPVPPGKSIPDWKEPKQVQDAVAVVSKPAEVSKDDAVVGQAEQHKSESH